MDTAEPPALPPIIAGWWSSHDSKAESAIKIRESHAKTEAGYTLTREEIDRGNAERAAILERVAKLEGMVQILANQIDARAAEPKPLLTAKLRPLPATPISGGAYE